jgi:hypothetical protein
LQPTVALPGKSKATVDFDLSKVLKRYGDAYLIAKVIVGAGTLIKLAAVVAGIITFLFALSFGLLHNAGINPNIVFIGSFMISLPVPVAFYVLAVIVSAQGQMLKAMLDTAVHSSPFLADQDRADVMSII